MNSARREVTVIGAGASGLMAAIMAARGGAKVRVLEGMTKPGRKLLLTGNGRCNLTNLDPALAKAYHGTCPAQEEQKTERMSDISETEPAGAVRYVSGFADTVLKQFGREDTIAFFEEIGLYTNHRDGYVYPRSGQASTVLAALQAEAARLKVQIRLDTKVKRLSRNADTGRWSAEVEGWTYESDAVIVCAGSKAVPSTGSDGSGYELVGKLGHILHPVFPALTAMSSPDPDLKLCAGARTRAAVELRIVPGKSGEKWNILGREEGELQWNSSEISGIPVFQLSRYVHTALHTPVHAAVHTSVHTTSAGANGKIVLAVDFLPEYSEEQVREFVRRQLTRCSEGTELSAIVSGFVHEKVAELLVKKAGLPRRLKKGSDRKKGAALVREEGTNTPASDTQAEQIAAALASQLKCLQLDISGTRGFDQAQVCAGGVALDEVDPHTMQSRLHKDLYFAGEILDIDGPCGGYNLQWAWSSGAVAGLSQGDGSLALLTDNS